MLRLLQTSDVHLGARHPLLGERAADQRRRQFEAFERTVELAASTPVELFIIAGDLFDSSVQPRSSMERVGKALARLAAAGIPTILVPGAADAPGRASIFRAYDLAAMSGGSGAGEVEVLTDEAPDAEIPALNVRLTSRFPASDLPDDGWRIGIVHREPTARRRDRRAGRGLSGDRRTASRRVRPGGDGELGSERAAGARRRRGGDTDATEDVLIVTLDDAAQPTIERLTVGRTRAERRSWTSPSWRTRPSSSRPGGDGRSRTLPSTRG